MHRPPAVAAVAIVSCGTLFAAQKLTQPAVIDLHLQALTADVEIPIDQTRVVRGVCITTSPAKAAGQLPGAFLLSSSVRNARFTVQFKSDLYEGESFDVEGEQVQIGFAQPRTNTRSALGQFVSINRVIVAEGLFGGVLNVRWPLLRISARQPRLGYEGIKKLARRNLHRLRYRARENQGDLDIHLYFEPETYRHVVSVYTTTRTQGLAFTPESSSQQSDLYFRLQEEFSDFQQVGSLTLPKTWTVRYERSGNSVSEWKYDLRVESVEVARAAASRAN